MGKSTRPVYWGCTVKTGRTVVRDMPEWAPRMCSATSSWLNRWGLVLVGWGGRGMGGEGDGGEGWYQDSPLHLLYSSMFIDFIK